MKNKNNLFSLVQIKNSKHSFLNFLLTAVLNRNKIYTLMLMVCFYITTAAQNIAIGLKLGASSSFPSVKTTGQNGGKINTTSLGGVAATVFFNIPGKKSFVIRPEISFTSKGAKVDYTNSGYSTYMDRIRQNYIELPVNFLYQYKTTSGSFFLGGGPVVSYNISNNYFYGNSQAIKKTDFGINAMATFEFSLGFSINLNYTHGITNIADKIVKNDSWKNRNICFKLGYLF